MSKSACRALVGLALCLSVGACASANEDEAASSANSVTTVAESPIRDQTIGNCWLYMATGWASSLANQGRSASTEAYDFSPAYLNYWYWYEQLTNESVIARITGGRFDAITEVEQGGAFGTAVELMLQYGLVRRGDFVADDEKAAAKALSTIMASLASGALSSPKARADRALVRRELDRAWALKEDVSSWLTMAFGEDGEGSLDDAVFDSRVLAARSIPITDANGPDTLSLADAIGTRAFPYTSSANRTGDHAWTLVPVANTSGTDRRDVVRRIQKTLMRGSPVPLTWWVSQKAVGSRMEFAAPAKPSAKDEWHASLLDDYEIVDVPGYGTLPAGVPENRASALRAALADEATIDFWRVKNSWGVQRTAVRQGYNDLYARYLDGPQKKCVWSAEGTTSACEDIVPFAEVYLPQDVDASIPDPVAEPAPDGDEGLPDAGEDTPDEQSDAGVEGTSDAPAASAGGGKSAQSSTTADEPAAAPVDPSAPDEDVSNESERESSDTLPRDSAPAAGGCSVTQRNVDFGPLLALAAIVPLLRRRRR